MDENPRLSVIIPTLNEADYICPTLESLISASDKLEIIVVDGGSEDDTVQLARTFRRVKILEVKGKGRSLQMNAGASIAKGPYLFFLHADTIPPKNFSNLILDTLEKDKSTAGSFFIRFDSQKLVYRMLSNITRLNFAYTTFGDQGLFLTKVLFMDLGGYALLPILEDLELQERLRRRVNFVKIPHPLITSARRFHRNGFIKQALIDSAILVGYFIGIAPSVLKSWYDWQNWVNNLDVHFYNSRNVGIIVKWI